MVKTRKMRLSARRSYKRRTRKSPCRGKGPAVCRGTSGCKYSSGKKRSFCRKGKNTRRHRGGNHSCPHKVGGSRKRRRKSGGSMLGKALLPFGLFAAQKAYSRRRR
jgi:hypothetical protein